MGALERTDDWPVERAAVGVTSAEDVLATGGPTDAVIEWASVTKLVTALATLVAVQDGFLDLDDEVGPQDATVRHLLAHAAGLPPSGREPIAPLGERRIYSNAGYELLAEVVEGRTGWSFTELVAEAVLQPLGMSSTHLAGSPAAGIEGPLDDLLRLGQELLSPSLLAKGLFEEATTVVFPDLDGVLPGYGKQEPNDWGLGFEIRDGKDPHWTGSGNSPRTFGHFGQSGSFLWVDPEVGLACACLTGTRFGDWAVEAWPPFNDAVIDEFAGT